MNKPFKISLITIAVLIGLLTLGLLCDAFLFADFFSGPTEKECVKKTEEFLGYKLGKEYEILDYDVKFYHPDQSLNFSIELPAEKFQKVIEFCESEAKKKQEDIRFKDGKYDVIMSPILRTSFGYQKTKEVLDGSERVYYQTVAVFLDECLIVFCGSSY